MESSKKAIEDGKIIKTDKIKLLFPNFIEM